MRTITFLTLTTFLFLSLSSIGQESERPFSFEEGVSISSDRDGEIECPANSIFSQPAVGSYGGLPSYSAGQLGSHCGFDSFNGITEEIVGIAFWGRMADGGGCVPGPVEFEISFYEDNGGTIGSLVQSLFVSTTPIETGFDFKRYEIEFTPVSLTNTNGWISIVGLTADLSCTFAWVGTTIGDNVYAQNTDGGPYYYGSNNLSFCLIGPPQIPISNWAIYFGIFLIGLFVIYRFRRKLA